MNVAVNSDRAAGVEPADASSGADHPIRVWRGSVADAQEALEDALRILEVCNRQETEAARCIVLEALGHLEEALQTREG